MADPRGEKSICGDDQELLAVVMPSFGLLSALRRSLSAQGKEDAMITRRSLIGLWLIWSSANCIRGGTATDSKPDEKSAEGPSLPSNSSEALPSPKREITLGSYLIAEPCIGTKDAACVDVCPTDAIHPRKDEPDFVKTKMLYINPEDCIDCSACVPACPVSATFSKAELPAKWKSYVAVNYDYYKQRAH